MKRVLSVLAAIGLVLGLTNAPANAGTQQSHTTDSGLTFSWTNPSAFPSGTNTMNVKFKIENRTQISPDWVEISISDRDGTEIGNEMSITTLPSGAFQYYRVGIFALDFKGTHAPYTVSFQVRGQSGWDIVEENQEYPFAFEVPTTIHCYKAGKARKTVTKYHPTCPAGYKKGK